MRAAATLLCLFVASAASAQQLVATARDGSTIVRELDTAPEIDVIVEFRDPPLAVHRVPMETYRANFARLRRDVAAMRQSKSAFDPLIRREYFEVFHGAALRIPRASLAGLRALLYVKRVHSDKTMHMLADQNIETIGAVKTWNTLGTRGAGVTVAILDTGIDYTHPALGGGFGAARKVIGGWDFVNDDANPMDDQGHGTHVAGIVAANLDDFTGVAPDATLLAYKVLNAGGSGSESDVLAALERALDPNGDGELSDRADVTNLSLGGDGNPDDAVSLAVDNAVAAGMVVCVASGNSGAYHDVSSPGTARDAITVGAVDERDAPATFTSKGPSPKLVSIKPDVLAPGVSIRSTYLKGGYSNLSGTSMATPHVAGAAALLRAVHPTWTPQEVKSALILYAKALLSEVMTQGGGRIDVSRAAQPALLAFPASISFGLDAQSSGTFDRTQRVRVENRGTKNESVTLTTDGSRHGVTVAVTPAKLELGPGSSAEATITIAITNADSAPITSDSYSYGGLVHLDTATSQTHVPWSVTKAARATVTTDVSVGGQFWLSARKVPSPAVIDEGTTETLMPAGDYDLLISAVDPATEAKKPTSHSIVVMESQSIRGEVALHATRALAKHTVTISGVGASGATLFRTSTPTVGYLARSRLLTPRGSYLESLDLPALDINTIHVSDLSDRWTLLSVETLLDREHLSYTNVAHVPLNGVSGNVELRNATSALLHAPVKLVFPSVPANRRVYVTSAILPRTTSTQLRGVSVFTDTTAREWSGDLYMTSDASTDFLPAFQLQGGALNAPLDLWVPAITAKANRIVVANAFDAADGEPIAFGTGPLYPRNAYTIQSSQLYPTFGFNGQAGEWRTQYDAAGFFTVRNSRGEVMATGTPFTANPVALSRGRYTIDFIATSLNLGDRLARAEVNATIDGTNGDVSTPVIASMFITDANGRAATRLTPHGTGTLHLATAATSAKAFFRFAGAATWTELTLNPVGQNRFEADLAPMANSSAAAVDLRIELNDTKGNRLVYTLGPALTVGDVPLLPRRRP